jgi:hypothetical protein
MVTQAKLESDTFEVDELDEEFDVNEETEDPTIFKIRDPLDPPRSAMYSIADLFRLF